MAAAATIAVTTAAHQKAREEEEGIESPTKEAMNSKKAAKAAKEAEEQAAREAAGPIGRVYHRVMDVLNSTGFQTLLYVRSTACDPPPPSHQSARAASARGRHQVD